MSNTIIKIHNAETNEIIEREMNTQELVQRQKDTQQAEEAKANAQAAAATKSALLAKLGITEEEAKLLLS